MSFEGEMLMISSTTQVLYSQNSVPSANVTGVLPNDVSGQGQFHFGAVKKGTGNNLTDVTKDGSQESGINEGVIYGGIFEEDSTKGLSLVKCKIVQGEIKRSSRLWGDYDHHFSCMHIFQLDIREMKGPIVWFDCPWNYILLPFIQHFVKPSSDDAKDLNSTI
jgi:hypothetical protein